MNSHRFANSIRRPSIAYGELCGLCTPDHALTLIFCTWYSVVRGPWPRKLQHGKDLMSEAGANVAVPNNRVFTVILGRSHRPSGWNILQDRVADVREVHVPSRMLGYSATRCERTADGSGEQTPPGRPLPFACRPLARRLVCVPARSMGPRAGSLKVTAGCVRYIEASFGLHFLSFLCSA